MLDKKILRRLKNGEKVRLAKDAAGYIHFDTSRFNAILNAPLDKRFEKFPDYMNYTYEVVGFNNDRYDGVYHVKSKEGCHIVIDTSGLRDLSILQMKV